MSKKTIGWLLVIFFIGGVAGMLGSQLFLPWLAGIAPFDRIDWIARSKDGTTIINKTERIIAERSSVDLETIGRLQNSAVAVRSQRANKILTEGSGFVLTSDGLIVTADILVPEKADKISIFWNNKEYAVKIIKRDQINGLILLKIEETSLPVAALGSNNLKLGQEVFSVGARISDLGIFSLFTHRGYLASLAPELTVDFKASQLSNGSFISDISGSIIGLDLIDTAGDIIIIGADKIRELLK